MKRIERIKAETSSKLAQIQNEISLAEKESNRKINNIQN